ncbi:MAG: Gfo/Idh/MocA family protein [Planctomycetota bacterium]
MRLGCIGTGGRGQHHIANFKEHLSDEVEIVAVSDVDPEHLEGAARLAGGSVRKTAEFREILDAKDIDAVVISTPDHWHAYPAIRACEAGKDVYVEKPIGHNVREGRLVADAAKKHGRVVAIGTQQRSGAHWIEAVRRIRAGEIGKVTFVHAWNAWSVEGMGGNLGNPPDSDPPAGVDYDRWLGPAPRRRFNPARFHFSFYFFWDYSGGMVSAWGVHLFDVVSWALGHEILAVDAVGGKLVHQDIRETPDTATATFECPGYTLTYTMRHGNGFPLYGELDHGIDFHGSKGTLRINRRRFAIFPEGSDKPSARVEAKDLGEMHMDIPHKKNWLQCIRDRKKPNADAEDGHRSSIYGHLANISYRAGRRIRWDANAEAIPGDSEASALLTREYRAPWAL